LEPDAGDALSRAVDMAGSIGVRVDMRGDPPPEGAQRSILAAAIRECAANTVKHAGGDRIFVEITKTAAGTDMTITNNGVPPKGPVAESGGLLSLRRSAEAAGGKALVQGAPAFSLTLSFMQ
jgi:signal transduction histidine kinase